HYLDTNLQQWALDNANIAGSAFGRGLGFGLGYSYAYHDTDFQDKILKIAEDNNQFAIGLGAGIGYVSQYLGNEFDKFLNMLADPRVQKPRGLAKGLGIGLGTTLHYYGSASISKIIGKEKSPQNGGGKIDQRNELTLDELLGYMFRETSDKISPNEFLDV